MSSAVRETRLCSPTLSSRSASTSSSKNAPVNAGPEDRIAVRTVEEVDTVHPRALPDPSSRLHKVWANASDGRLYLRTPSSLLSRVILSFLGIQLSATISDSVSTSVFLLSKTSKSKKITPAPRLVLKLLLLSLLLRWPPVDTSVLSLHLPLLLLLALFRTVLWVSSPKAPTIGGKYKIFPGPALAEASTPTSRQTRGLPPGALPAISYACFWLCLLPLMQLSGTSKVPFALSLCTLLNGPARSCALPTRLSTSTLALGSVSPRPPASGASLLTRWPTSAVRAGPALFSNGSTISSSSRSRFETYLLPIPPLPLWQRLSLNSGREAGSYSSLPTMLQNTQQITPLPSSITPHNRPMILSAPSPRSTLSPLPLACLGNCPKTSTLGHRQLTLVFNGSLLLEKSVSQVRSRPSTTQPFESGSTNHHTPSLPPSPSMAVSSMQPSSCLKDASDLAYSNDSLPSCAAQNHGCRIMLVLLCAAIWSGGLSSSLGQIFAATSLLTQTSIQCLWHVMRQRASESELSLKALSSQCRSVPVGLVAVAISLGSKLSPLKLHCAHWSNEASTTAASRYSPTMHRCTLRSGKDEAETPRSLPFSRAFASLKHLTTSSSYPVSSRASTTLQTTRLEEFAPPPQDLIVLSFRTSSNFIFNDAEWRRFRQAQARYDNIVPANSNPTPQPEITHTVSRPQPVVRSRRALDLPQPASVHLVRPRSSMLPRAPRNMPLVPAHRRLLEWVPSSSTLHHSRDPAQRARVLAAAWTPATMRTYSSGVLRWLLWCGEHSVRSHAQFPIALIDLVDFIEQHAGHFSGRTIRNWVNGLRAWHIIHGASLDTQNARLSIALRGADRLTPEDSKRPPRPPFQLAHLHALRSHFAMGEAFDSAVWACLVVAFWGLARLGELVVATGNSFDRAKNPTRSALRWKRLLQLSPVAFSADIHLPWTKTAPRGEKIIITPKYEDPCPVRALRHHLVKNQPSMADHLFGYRVGDCIVPLTRSAFLNRLQLALAAAGLSHLDLRGHSLRTGGCTTLLIQGKSLDAVRLHGRWTSDAWRLYLRRHVEIIAPLLMAEGGSPMHILNSLAAAAI